MWQCSRFECKYMIPLQQVPAVRRWIRMFLEPDPFTATRPDGSYPICSLYLDSPDLQLYRMTECGAKNRFKLRIRSYSDDPMSPLFFEIKRRMDRTIRKSRVSLCRAGAHAVLSGRVRPGDVAVDEDMHHLDTFLHLMRHVAAGPVTRVHYKREAYESTANDKVRLTLDQSLCFMETLGYEFALGGREWARATMGGVLLEMKFTDCYPQWVAEMINHFELRKIPFSKYGTCVKGALQPVHRVQRQMGAMVL